MMNLNLYESAIDTHDVLHKLLNGQLLFIDFVDFCEQNDCFEVFFNDEIFFDSIFDQHLATSDDIEYLYQSLFSIDEFHLIFLHQRFLAYVLETHIADPQELLKLYSTTRFYEDELHFDELLSILMQSKTLDLNLFEFLRFQSKFKNECCLNFYENLDLLLYFAQNASLTFQELIDFLKKHLIMKELLDNTKFFEYSFKKNLLDQKTLKTLYKSLSYSYEFKSFYNNLSLLKCVIQKKLFTFQEILDVCLNKKLLSKLLNDESFFVFLLKKSKVTKLDAMHIVENLSGSEEYAAFVSNFSFLVFALKNNLVKFDSFIDQLKTFGLFDKFLKNEELFRECFDNSAFDDAKIQKILNSVDKDTELFAFVVNNQVCTKYALDNFLLTKLHVSKFNALLKSKTFCAGVMDRDNFTYSLKIYDIFDFLKLACERYYEPSYKGWPKRNRHRTVDEKELRSFDFMRILCKFESLNRIELQKLFEILKKTPKYAKKLEQIFLLDFEHTFKDFDDLVFWLEHVHIQKNYEKYDKRQNH